MASILSLLQLSAEQAAAVTASETVVSVTAGAGSGKTRTLAGRYLALAEQGASLRSLVAITFTEKAAREMRDRIRQTVDDWRRSPEGADQALWGQAVAELDSARIGTIHSLCAEILRAHPAEAAVDPGFAVLEENTAALLRARSIEEALAWAMEDPGCARLVQLGALSEHRLRQTLTALLQSRLDASLAFQALAEAPLDRWSARIDRWLAERLQPDGWRQSLASLETLCARKPDDKLEQARQEVLGRWATVQTACAAGDWTAALSGLAELRKALKPAGGAKGNWDADALESARLAMASLRDHYDAQIAPLADRRPQWALDQQVAVLLPDLHRLFSHALSLYDGMKAERQALDFDDLEAMTAALLSEQQDVRARWQDEVAAVLVDEFQDTNERQRAIVYALAGFMPLRRGSLFVVGDAKQSIYRFRRADVAIFRQVQTDIAASGGLCADLSTTYRAHRSLVETLNTLLAPILGQEDTPHADFQTAFAPLQAHRSEPRASIASPFLEFHLGVGEDAGRGRMAAAAGLADRLRQLHMQGVQWREMALLFRASSAFGVYEDALERAGIPFVTVAGRGFYERPEVRDLLNALAAIADPGDDLAMAGLLRSPGFGLTDGALYLLRWHGQPGAGRPQRLWQGLHDPGRLRTLSAQDAALANRARDIVEELHVMAGRTSVAEVLKRLLDLTHYRAALRLLPGGERAWRNVDKLLADAHRSQLVGVGDFLEYVQSLRDVAAHEGEAPDEASSAVQLMTVHKAKGLEFPVVVIADAARRPHAAQPPLLLDTEFGVVLNVDDPAGDTTGPVAYRLAALRQMAMDEAEERRLLYVAATRAEELLLVSGHASISTARSDPGRVSLAGWLNWLGEVVGLPAVRIDETLAGPRGIELAWHGGGVACMLYPWQSPAEDDLAVPGAGLGSALVAPDASPPGWALTRPIAVGDSERVDDKLPDRESEPPPRVWRVAPRTGRPHAPAWVVGKLVHAALRRWRFPGDQGFEELLAAGAVESGLTDAGETKAALAEASRLLARFAVDPLRSELDKAERHHELPFDTVVDGVVSRGIVDLLARPQRVPLPVPAGDSIGRNGQGSAWHVYDFKSDRLPAGADLRSVAAEAGYERQVRFYGAALAPLLGETPGLSIVFLNVGGQVEIMGYDAW